jgi:hypothetical protein
MNTSILSRVAARSARVAAILLLSTGFVACADSAPSPGSNGIRAGEASARSIAPSTAKVPEALFGDWQDIHERSPDERTIFVPLSVDLAPSRFRRTLHFGRDGTFSMLRLDPADAHYRCTGTFALVAEDVIEALCKDPVTQEMLELSIRILEASPDRLTLRMPPSLDPTSTHG